MTSEPIACSSADLAGAFGSLDAALEGFRQDQRIPGMAWGVVVEGDLAHTGAGGWRDIDAGLAAGPDSVFRIASMTKSITAMCVLHLRDEGLLALDDPAVDYVPELSGLRYPTTDAAAVSIRSLLTMSSGLVEDDPWGDRQLGLDHVAFRALLADGLGFDHSPQTVYEYSNTGYAILGAVVRSVSGLSLRDLAAAQIFEPLQMAATTWDADRLQPQADGSARGYRLEGGEWVIEDPLPDGAFGAMGGLATSVRDFSKYVTAHLGAWPPRDDPELGPLRRSSMREMAQSWRSTAIEDDSGILAAGYGYGLKVEIHRRYGRMVGHSGGLPGFGSHAAWLPDHGVGLMVFANRTYAKARLAVGLALEELAGTGALVARRSPTSPDLIQAQQGLAQLYGQWDDRVAGEIVLETATLDRDDDRRWPDLAELSSRYGACVGLGPIEPTGALRGSWRMDCQRGSLQLTVMLGPTCPKIQFLSVKELVPPGGEPSA